MVISPANPHFFLACMHIETVVAFLNSNRGTILVGVKDNGEIVGSKKMPKIFIK